MVDLFLRQTIFFMNKNIILSIIYFTLSTIITWWFIEASPLYISTEQKLLSCAIAGGKWGLQLLAAFIFLGGKKWDFIKNIAFTCLVGSVILLPYAILSVCFAINNASFFIGSLMVAVAVMILLYALSVQNAGVKIQWWLGWLCCLAIAITLQLTVVFHVF